jgi:hypothetical protein
MRPIGTTNSSSKISITLRPDLMRFLEIYQTQHALESRSAVIQQALEMLRLEALATEYREASKEWDASPDAAIWDHSSGDGLGL